MNTRQIFILALAVMAIASPAFAQDDEDEDEEEGAVGTTIGIDLGTTVSTFRNSVI